MSNEEMERQRYKNSFHVTRQRNNESYHISGKIIQKQTLSQHERPNLNIKTKISELKPNFKLNLQPQTQPNKSVFLQKLIGNSSK